MKVAIPLPIFSATSSQSKSSVNCARLSNAPLIPVVRESAISEKFTLSKMPFRASATALPSSCQPVIPALFFLAMSCTKPSNIRHAIINLFPRAFPNSLHGISSIIPRSPCEMPLPILSKSMPVAGSVRRLNVRISVVIPAPTVRPIISQSMLSTRLLKVLVNASQNSVTFGPTFFQLIAS